MRKIAVCDAVWAAIAERGKFGETEDDVLRRVFGIASANRQEPSTVSHGLRRGRTQHAERRLSNDMVRNGRLYVELEGVAVWVTELPEKSDKQSIRRVRDAACAYARQHGATDGQLNAIGKALQQAGYYLRGPRKKNG